MPASAVRRCEGHTRKCVPELATAAGVEDRARVCDGCFWNNFSVRKGRTGDFSFSKGGWRDPERPRGLCRPTGEVSAELGPLFYNKADLARTTSAADFSGSFQTPALLTASFPSLCAPLCG